MSGLATEQVLYATLQDAEVEADKLDPASPHRAHEMAAERAEQACAELSAHFAERGASWRMRLAQYREHKQRGD